ncbi:MAG: hypothetical protein K2Y21_03640 [Phycisphaerales bacterium]|nr:hypothetical protein [Phycisphaerales bacterium]
MQPGRQLRTPVESLQRPERAQKGVLHRVLGVRLGRHHLASHRQHAARRGIDQFVERRSVFAPQPREHGCFVE